MGVASVVGLDDTERTKRRTVSPRRGGGAALRVLQALLLTAGATLLAVYAAAQIDGARSHARALDAFERARSEQAPAAQGASPAPAAPLDYPASPDQSLWGKTRIAAYQAAVAASAEVPLGVLAIPAVRLEAAIFEGTSELTLNRGIGRIEGTASVGDTAGNLGLAAHRDGFFRVLKDVQIGDVLSVRTLNGVTHYRVTELLVVEPTDVYVLAPTQEATLTLVTCYPFYFIGEAPQRYIVKGVAEDPVA